jgi:Rieske Fe-S protein
MASCASISAGCPLANASTSSQVIDAGPVGNYVAEGVHDAYRALGFFIISKGGNVSAVSSICTHRQVTLTVKADCTFYCKRHGSTFDSGGHVTKGPANKDLPKLSTSVSSAGHLLVTIPG